MLNPKTLGKHDIDGRLNCQLVCYSNSPLLAYLYTGFKHLHQSGEIHLMQRFAPRRSPNPSQPYQEYPQRDAHLRVVVADQIRIHFDVHDGYNLDEDIADAVDFYFKRSFASHLVPDRLRGKVFPLGFAYQIYPKTVDAFELQRGFRCARSFSKCLKSVSFALSGPYGVRHLGFRPTASNLDSASRVHHEKSVLFVTRAWSTSKGRNLGNDRLEEREKLNESRANCIRALRKEFGKLFVGGFAPSEQATKNYPDLLFDDLRLSRRWHYFDRVQAASVCVSTNGIRLSVPWKIAEYVLNARAIVTEPLYSESPGNFGSGRNYLEFIAADQCVNACERLRSNDELREKQMLANQQYARSVLQAEQIVRDALRTAIENSPQFTWGN